MKVARHIRAYIYILALLLAVGIPQIAGGVALSFNPLLKLRIEAVCINAGSVVPGNTHAINSPLGVVANSATSADSYWYFKEYKQGKFAICNASTGQYMTWDMVRSDSPMRRYLTLTNELRGDSSLWIVDRDISTGNYYFNNVAGESYYFNVRTSSAVLGTYSHSSGSNSTNEFFRIIKEDGSDYDETVDGNTLCGITSDQLYWADYGLSQPVVYTSDDSSPIYYYIKNVRSGNYVVPDGHLLQNSDKPAKRFYFKQVNGGVQLMVEGGGYVSGKLTESTDTTPNDIAVVSGKPADNDQVWRLSYAELQANSGYSVGLVNSSDNSPVNPHFSQSRIYWNDLGGGAICWFAVDQGSTFMFYSSDVRHRNYLASQGLVIPIDTLINNDPISPPVGDTTSLQPLSGKINYIYRADGKIDAIPQMYVASLTQTADSIIVSTLNSGPIYRYARYEVDSISTNVPVFPKFNSFKFNNKFNRHIISDAVGQCYGDSLIKANVIGIGKTLRPSFKLDDDAQAFIGNQLQLSKETRVRFSQDVTYTIARRGQTILRCSEGGTYCVWPLGRQIVVHVDFATDHSNSQYNVPYVHITTDNGTSITSKDYYWDAKIIIDGAGVFPNMPETPMHIKGRGNSSWTATGKAPYHMKFDEAVSVLGLKKGKHWNLIANAQRQSMTSNAVAMKMAQMVETAGFNHEIPVDLYINGEYRGSYNLTEKVGFSNNSIDLDDETNAVMLELDSYYDEQYKFRTTSYRLPVNIKEPDLSEGISPLTLTEISNNFNNAMDALYYGEDISGYIDLDYLARFLLVDELTENYEFMHPKSTFLYNPNIKDSDSKYVFGPVWDFDWGYGYERARTYFSSSPTNDYWNTVSMANSQWARDMRYCGDDFNRIYYKLWYDFVNDGRLQELIDFCDDYYAFAAPSFTHDNTVWGQGNAAVYATLTEKAKTWLKARAQYVVDYMGNTLGYNELGYAQDISQAILIGDVNKDGVITTADIVCVLNYILSLANEEFDFDQADTDNNSIITVADLINVRNLVGQQPVPSGRFYSLPEAEAKITAGDIAYSSTGLTLPLNVWVESGDYCGIQFDMKLPAGMTVDNMDISASIPQFDSHISAIDNHSGADASTERYRVSIYSDGKHCLPVGKSMLTLELGWGSASKSDGLHNAIFSDVMFVSSMGEDERSRAFSAPFCMEEITGINSAISIVAQDGKKIVLESSKDSVLSIYGVDGRLYRLYNVKVGRQEISLPCGIYIINHKKVVVK